MRNIELKAHDRDPARTLELALALGAADEGDIVQRDTYFAAGRGRLKLREETRSARLGGATAELIAYRRPDGERPRVSEYERAPVADAGATLAALEAAHGTLVTVRKRRRLLLWEGVRIHLDDVDGLGTFLELEAVAPERSDLSAEREKVARLRAALEVDDAALVASSYSDLLLDGPEALLAAAQAAMAHAHVPYSRFPVGAALRSASGSVHVGANVENAAYPESQCAEASAIAALVSAGETRIAAIAVVARRREVCPPCGGCRQRLAELAPPETPVHLGRPGGPASAITTVTLGELLPMAFGREELEP
ncbi:MAG TPA: cytidine deaminase [Solirubrobacteraceae bacterium]|nr:cytidine deaminase [Solirubrobacteraceae bacterium]